MTGSELTRISRNEWVYLVFIIAFATVLRFWSPGHIAVEHFDEGVYSSNQLLTSPELGFPRYPYRELYAPPLVPFLSEICRGPNSWQPILPGLLAGILTIPAIWWLTRIWFGPLAGMISGTIAAFSDFHILYSRTILTEAPSGLFLILAVTLISLSYTLIDRQTKIVVPTGKQKKRTRKQNPEPTKSSNRSCWILAGVLTSFAWWTKYNGWLPLAIGISGLVPWLIFNQASGKPKGKFLICWAVISVVAWVLWMPVIFGLSDSGGYAAVAANHRGYLVGIENWWSSLVRQYQNHLELDGILSIGSLLIATILATIWSIWNSKQNQTGDSGSSNNALREIWLVGGIGIFLAGLASGLGTSLVLVMVCLVGGAASLWKSLFKRDLESSKVDPARKRNCWLLIAWFVGMALATPFYRAYPRLTLPLLIACWIGTGGTLSLILNQIQDLFHGSDLSQLKEGSQKNSEEEIINRKAPVLIVSILSLVGFGLLLMQSGAVIEKGIPGWEDRTALKNISDEIVLQISETKPVEKKKNSMTFFAMYGQPALCHHLGIHAEARFQDTGEVPFVPIVIGNLSSFLSAAGQLKGEQYLVISRKSLETELKSEWLLVKNKFEEIGKYPYFPSKLVSLNEFSPEELNKMKQGPEFEIILFRVR